MAKLNVSPAMAVVAVGAVAALGAATMGTEAKTSHEVRVTTKLKFQNSMSNCRVSNRTIRRRLLTLVVATQRNLNQRPTTRRVSARWDRICLVRRDQARGLTRNSVTMMMP